VGKHRPPFIWIEDFKRKLRSGEIVYWKGEQSGRMKDIVLRFFSPDKPLTDEEIDILKWYIDQWVDAMPYRPPQWREKLAACRTKKALRDYCRMLLTEYAIDPF